MFSSSRIIIVVTVIWSDKIKAELYNHLVKTIKNRKKKTTTNKPQNAQNWSMVVDIILWGCFNTTSTWGSSLGCRSENRFAKSYKHPTENGHLNHLTEVKRNIFGIDWQFLFISGSYQSERTLVKWERRFIKNNNNRLK